MKWTTAKQAKAAAKRGKIPALRHARKHWLQMIEATAKELRQGCKKYDTGIEEKFCALCHLDNLRRSTNVDKLCQGCCLLTQPDENCGNSLVNEASTALENWRRKEGKISTFRTAGKKVVALMDKILAAKTGR